MNLNTSHYGITVEKKQYFAMWFSAGFISQLLKLKLTDFLILTAVKLPLCSLILIRYLFEHQNCHVHE